MKKGRIITIFMIVVLIILAYVFYGYENNSPDTTVKNFISSVKDGAPIDSYFFSSEDRSKITDEWINLVRNHSVSIDKDEDTRFILYVYDESGREIHSFSIIVKQGKAGWKIARIE